MNDSGTVDSGTVDSGTVFVIDDDDLVLSSIQALLSSHGRNAKCFSNAAEFLAAVNVNQVGCVISDLEMPGLSGLDLQRLLNEQQSPLAIIIVTGHAEVSSTVTLMQNGAVTLLEKPYDTMKLLAAIDKAFAHSRITRKRQDAYRDAVARISKLDEEELQVMECAIRGMPIKAISDHLTLSNRTVDRRRQSAISKTGVASVSEFAVLLALYRGDAK